MLTRVRQVSIRADSLRRFALDSSADTLQALTGELAHNIPIYQQLLADSSDIADSVSALAIFGPIGRAEQAIRRSERSLQSRMTEGVRAAQERAQTAQSVSAGAFAIAGLLNFPILLASAQHHFRWAREQAQHDPERWSAALLED